MTLSDITAYVYRRTEQNSTSFPAADMLIAINNGLERVETLIRPWSAAYNATRYTSGDLSTGTLVPKFNSRFHEVLGLWVSVQRATEKLQKSASGLASELMVKEEEMVRWYGLHNFRECTMSATTDAVTLQNHDFQTNDKVIFETTGALLTGISGETWYYVIRIDNNTFKLASSIDGSAIDLTSSATGTQFVGCERQGGLQRNAVNNQRHSNK